jgi:predicted outer membrane protein
MVKPKFLLALAALPLAACGAEETPQPDPAAVQRLLASLEAEAAAAAAPAAKIEEKVEKAERLVAAVDRADPDRFNGVAERLLAP